MAGGNDAALAAQKRLDADASVVKDHNLSPVTAELNKDFRSRAIAANPAVKAAIQHKVDEILWRNGFPADFHIVGVRNNRIIESNTDGHTISIDANGTVRDRHGRITQNSDRAKPPAASGRQIRGSDPARQDAMEVTRRDLQNNNGKHTLGKNDLMWDIAAASAETHSGLLPSNTEIAKEVVRLARQNKDVFGIDARMSDTEVTRRAGKITPRMLGREIDMPKPGSDHTEVRTALALRTFRTLHVPPQRSDQPASQTDIMAEGDDGQKVYFAPEDTDKKFPTRVEFPVGENGVVATTIGITYDEKHTVTKLRLEGQNGRQYQLKRQEDNSYEVQWLDGTTYESPTTYRKVDVQPDGKITMYVKDSTQGWVIYPNGREGTAPSDTQAFNER